MNLGLAYIIGFTWGLRRALRNPPPNHPPNYVNPDYSTGVPPPPFVREEDCPLDHSSQTRCRMCEALRAEKESKC